MKRLFTLLLAAIALTATMTYADEGLDSLKLFKSGGIQHGKWQLELLEGSDPSMQQMMQKAGKMSICMDMAKQLARNFQYDKQQTNTCTHRVINESTDSAEVDVTCESGSHIHSLISRDGDKAYNVETDITTKDGKPRHMKMHYQYLGECSNDGLIQFDKDSAACKMIRKNAQGADMSAMCAKLPEKMRAQCETNMKQAQASCQ